MKRIDVALVGFGLRASGLAIDKLGGIASNLCNSQEFNIVAICDNDSAKLARAEKLLPGVKTVSDYKNVLKDDSVEAVIIAAPQFQHKEIAISAFELGKHVYCEKPLALNIQECNEMIDASKKAEKVFLVGQQMRYHSHLNKMISLIKNGEIGQPVMAWLREFRNPFPETMRWVFDKEQSGGMLMDKSCHHFDVLHWMLDSEPISVFASGEGDVFPDPFETSYKLEDNAYVTIDFANGSRALLHLCMFMGLPYKYECGIGHHMREMGVLGKKGMLRTEGFDLGNTVELRYNKDKNITKFEVKNEGCIPEKFNQNGNTGIIMDFADCIRNNKEPIANAEVGKRAVAIAQVAEISMKEKRIVYLDEFNFS
jgi:predicted dehydrogenase